MLRESPSFDPAFGVGSFFSLLHFPQGPCCCELAVPRRFSLVGCVSPSDLSCAIVLFWTFSLRKICVFVQHLDIQILSKGIFTHCCNTGTLKQKSCSSALPKLWFCYKSLPNVSLFHELHLERGCLCYLALWIAIKAERLPLQQLRWVP